MARFPSDRRCSEPGCKTTITHQSKTGRCRPCAMRIMHADPGYQQRRLDGMRRRNAEPGERERRIAWLQAGRKNMSEEAKAALSAHGRRQIRDFLSKPEIKKRAHGAEAQEKRIASYVETCMGWCPEPLRARYHELVRSKRVPAAEARRMIEAEIPGTAEHARFQIANTELAARLRDERWHAEAY